MSDIDRVYKRQNIPDAPPAIVLEKPSGTREPIGSTASQGRDSESVVASTKSQDESIASALATHDTLRSVSPSDSNTEGDEISWTISYTSRVIFESSPARKLPTSQRIAIHDVSNYNTINARISKFVRENFGGALGSKELILRYANCTFIGNKGYRARLPMTSRKDWNAIVTRIRKWDSDETLHLDILQEFLTRTRMDFVDGSKEVRMKVLRRELHRLMKPNGDGKLYIPRKDLKEIMSSATIRSIVDNNSALSNMARAREDLVEHIYTKARTLFALWLYADLEPSCLQELLKKELTDHSLPLRGDQICHSECELEFNNLLMHQGGFITVRLDRPYGCQNLHPSQILPIHYCPKGTALQYLTDGQPEHEPGKSKMDPQTAEGESKTKAKLGHGGFSVVYCVRIDPYHHTLTEVMLLIIIVCQS